MTVTFVTNIPAPYRERLHESLSILFKCKYSVVYCAEKELDREWEFTLGNYDKFFLSKVNRYKGVHNNFNILFRLNKLKPDIVITNGFYPTMIYAFLWAKVNRKKHIVFTDGTLKSESGLSIIHRFTRKVVFFFTVAFIGTSLGSEKLYESYQIKAKRIFRTFLCVDNTRFYSLPFHEKKYELMFSGQLIERKMPMFFIEVARQVQLKMGYCRVLIVGNGPLKNEILEKLNNYGIDYDYPGFVNQAELPDYYSRAKLLLFPTLNDPWGVVANEAMASGVPVITCENAGVAGDLVIHETNGFILPIDVDVWANKIQLVLNSPRYYKIISENAFNYVKNFNFERASNCIYDALTCI